MAILFVFRRRHPILICFDRTRGNLHGIQLGGQTSGPRGSRKRSTQPEIIGEDRKSEEGEPEAPPLRSRTCRSEEADMPSNNGGRKSGKISDKVGYGTRTFSTDPPLRKIFGGAALAGPPSRERGGPRRRARRAAASPDTTVRGRTRGGPDAPPPLRDLPGEPASGRARTPPGTDPGKRIGPAGDRGSGGNAAALGRRASSGARGAIGDASSRLTPGRECRACRACYTT